MTNTTPKWLHRVIELQEKDVIGISDKCTVHDFERRYEDRGCWMFALAFGVVAWALIGLIIWWVC